MPKVGKSRSLNVGEFQVQAKRKLNSLREIDKLTSHDINKKFN